MNDTPRMKAAQMVAMEHSTGDVWRVGCQLERELNAANAEIERLTAKVAQLYEGAEEQNDRIKRLEAVVNDPHALWANWLRGDVKLPEGIGDVRQYQDRIKRLEEALDLVRPHCSFVHHSKKHQHAYDEPCPVVALIEKAKEAKP